MPEISLRLAMVDLLNADCQLLIDGSAFAKSIEVTWTAEDRCHLLTDWVIDWNTNIPLIRAFVLSYINSNGVVENDWVGRENVLKREFRNVRKVKAISAKDLDKH